jgi:hypothetical protein
VPEPQQRLGEPRELEEEDTSSRELARIGAEMLGEHRRVGQFMTTRRRVASGRSMANVHAIALPQSCPTITASRSPKAWTRPCTSATSSRSA